MTGELAERIRSSFANDRPSDVAGNVKSVVAAYLHRADPAVTVKSTNYFNHSFVPDFVLTWPRDSIDRYVYLRANNDPEWLQDDIDIIGARHPFMMTLTATQPNGSMQEIASSAKQLDTLVAEPGTLETLSQARRNRPVAGLLGSALLQGGRGVISEASAGSAVEATAGGFEAAKHVSKEPTQEAARLFDEILANPQSERLTRVLRFIWEGHGGAATDFPATRDIATQLTGADLRYLLDSIDTDDDMFWRRIGRNLALELITRIPADNMPVTFQRLVNANATILIAKAIRVAQTEARLDDPDDLWEWFLESGNLALHGNNFTAFIAPTTVESLPSVPLRDGPTFPELRRRAQEEGLTLGGVKVVTERASTVTFESKAEANIIRDEDFANISEALGAVRVREAVVTAAGKRLICDLEKSTAAGQSTATFPVSELVRVAVPLMLPVDDATHEKLEKLAIKRESGPGGEQLNLWE